MFNDIFKFTHTIKYKKRIINNIIKKHNAHFCENENYKRGDYNFFIESDDKLDLLYDFFYLKAKEVYGNFTLSENNSKKIWAHVSQPFDPTDIHNHIDTSTINCVYYLQVPDKTSGQIEFYDDYYNLITEFYPREGDMLIFPNYLNHKPLTCNSEIHRISLNMEITCNENLF